MKKLSILSFGVALGALFVAQACSSQAAAPEPVAQNSEALSSGLVIAEVYGGGGNSTAVLDHDYVVLFNRGTSAVSLSLTDMTRR